MNMLFVAVIAASTMLEPWRDPSVNSMNRLPARAVATPCESAEKALAILMWELPREASKWVERLDGEWDFKWKHVPSVDWEKSAKIAVPGCWQLQGEYDPPLYVNRIYPIAKTAPDPMCEPPKEYTSHYYRNPVGLYSRSFTVPAEWRGRRIVIRLDGVSSAFYLRVNGKTVGYSEDSRVPAEFDVTDYLLPQSKHPNTPKPNNLSIEVYKHCDGTYLEDQDFFRLSGVFRSVWLLAEDRAAPRDVVVETALADDYSSGRYVIRDEKGRILKEKTIAKPRLWDSDDPYLYYDTVGSDHRAVAIGFRKIEIKNGVLHLNGRRLLVRGVNRHEMSPERGYALTREEMLADMKLLKDYNFNAVRTCHYPNAPDWYELCDREGIMLCAEANVEAHGYPIYNTTNSLSHWPTYEKSFVERGTRMVETYRNHPSVIFWSMGNESGSGPNFAAEFKAMRALDATRPIQYENLSRTSLQGRESEYCDVECPMYPPVWMCEDYLTNNAAKPMILSEYQHAQGNSNGSLEEYWELTEKYPMFQGGFLWDFADQALWQRTASGRRLAYGGDWGDRPNNGDFCCNGLFDALRRPHPAAYEVRYIYGEVKAGRAVRAASAAVVGNKRTTTRGAVVVTEGAVAPAELPKVVAEAPSDWLKLNFWRAPTDNDKGWKMPAKCRTWKDATTSQKLPEGVKSELKVGRTERGDFLVTWKLTVPEGLPPIPRVGLTFKLPAADLVEYAGLGPWENYSDRRLSAVYGRYTCSLDSAAPFERKLNPENYVIPAEQGYRTGCDWLKVGSTEIKVAKGTFGFNVWPWSQEALEAAEHQEDLVPGERLTVNVDAVQMGVGGDNSWSFTAHEPYMPRAGVYELAFTISAIPEKNFRAPITFDARGRIGSLKDSRGRELVGEPVEMVCVFGKDGSERLASGFERANDELRYAFANGDRVVLGLAPFDGGWTFEISEAKLSDAKELVFAAVKPVCGRWVGNRANLFSDERSGVCLRAYDFATDMGASSSAGLTVNAKLPVAQLKGLRAGLCAGTREDLVGQLKEMTLVAGVPRTATGGAWSLEAAENRRSYLFADLSAASIEDWIALAKRAGISIIHFHMWWHNLGSYPPSRKFFPGGLPEMKATVKKVHDAGLFAGMHTLTASIDPLLDDWVRDEQLNQDLFSQKTYTLAKPIGADDDVLYVNEEPQERHDLVFSYHSIGNTLRVGGELIDYTGVKREKPYGFTGLKRGAFGTRRAAHAAGAKCDYLRQRYLAFYPKVGTKLASMLADRIAEVYNTCGFDQIYFDGAEEPRERYQIDEMRRQIFSRLDQRTHPVIDESSYGQPHYWWFHSRVGAADHPRWGAKRFHDEHVRLTLAESRDANLMAPMLGWWAPRKWNDAVSRGHFPDEIEYYAAKVVGLDSAMAIQGVDVTEGPLPEGQLRMMTYLGWYERPKVAGAFTESARQALAVPGDEFRLRQDETGRWMLTPAECAYHWVRAGFDSNWQIAADAPKRAVVRVEALLGASDDYETAPTVFGAGDAAAGALKTECADGVSADCAVVEDAVRGRVLKMTAANSGAGRRGADGMVLSRHAVSTAAGAWAKVMKEYPYPYLDLKGRLGIGVWVKGDGSGAILNVELQNAREFMYAYDANIVKLDFTGWRYYVFLNRERDGYEWAKHKWPFGGYYAVWGNDQAPEHIHHVGFWLNDVPAGGRTEVELSDIRLLAETRPPLKDGRLAVNGGEWPLPFTLEAGDYAELEGTVWTRYDRYGEPLERAKAAKAIELRAGTNDFAFSPARAEVTVFQLGESQAAFMEPLTAEMRKVMDVEFCETAVYAPKRGFSELPEIRIRPGEKARIAVRAEKVPETARIVFEDASGTRCEVRPGEVTPPFSGAVKVSAFGAEDVKFYFEKRYADGREEKK